MCIESGVAGDLRSLAAFSFLTRMWGYGFRFKGLGSRSEIQGFSGLGFRVIKP